MSRARFGVTLFAALGLIVLLTVGKSAVSIPGLWEASVHHTRALRLVPFGDFFRYSSPIIPLYYLASNVLLFVPLGWVLRHRTRHAVWFGMAVSVAVECTQFVFALGFTDLNDVIHNTLGAALGAWLAPRLSLSTPILVAFVFTCGLYLYFL
ncbi:MAG: VanZ family protein [Corynebacterium glucuronolyticum]|nr:VanZ family protein [Corynebacterium glucuronolyticum]